MGQLTDIFALSSSQKTRGAVCEVYSPPRVVPLAAGAGLPAGWSLDLITMVKRGQTRILDRADCRTRCQDVVKCLASSSMCTWFSTLQAMN